ncbi:MAG TPA: hypothetical protein VHC45_12455 [Gaiellaceae bacterium]|jgi:hypothetical protein|nr:hypothetical protein [Gaiellaceae bacterium]
MRRLCVILLAAGCLVPAALAAPTAVGDGTLSADSVNGVVVVVARGAIWGQIDRGSITVLDKDPDLGPAPRVSNFTASQPGVAPGSEIYTGSNLHFQLGGPGRYRIDLSGSGIDFTAVGAGRARFAGSLKTLSPGTYAVGDQDWLPVAYAGTPGAISWVAFPGDDTTPSSP